nr:ribonuclease H-like domain-containing protein [Tanacetum cinerariifolium]
MFDEYNALIKNKTWTSVPRPEGANIVRCMWLFRHKFLDDGTLSRYKARLVANGSTQVEGVDVDETFSPVVKPGTIRTVLSLAISRHWPVHQLDVKNAFLHGDLAETRKYAMEILERAHMVGCNPSRTPVDTESKLRDGGTPVVNPTLYRSLAGSLQYLTFTRPDITYVVQQVCLYMHDPWEPHFSSLKWILRYVQGTLDYGLQLFSSTTDSLITYSDADWAGCLTMRRSTSGYCVFLGNNLLSWSSKRQPTLSRSSAEAEYRGVANDVAETCWIRNLLRELRTPLSSATIMYCDNMSDVYLSSNLVQHQRTKHIEIDIHFVWDLAATGYTRHLAEKLHQEKVQEEKLKVVKARLNFEKASRYSESETPREKDPKRRTVFKRLEKGVFHRLGDKEKNVSAHSRGSEPKSYYSSCRDTESCYQSSRSKETEIDSEKHRHKSEYSRRTGAVSEKTNHFTPRIRYFDFPKARMPSHIKTYDESEHPEDHLKIFQAASKTTRWAMPTWCHMFNSTLTENASLWFDDLPKESIDSYDDLRKTFLENYLQQKKCIKYPVEIHNIKQKDGESTEEFVRRYKLECRDVKGAPKCIKISGFMHGITNPELIKRLHDKIPKSIDEIMSITTAFQVNRRNAKGRKALTFDQGIKSKPWKRPSKDSKKGENLRERQTADNINGAAMAKDSKAKNYLNFLPEINNFFPNSKGRRWDRSGWRNSHIVEQQDHPARMLNGFRTRSTAHIAEHRLNVREGCLPIRQKKRGQAPERNKAISEEVKKLVETDIMKKVHYHSWLSNPVMVKKHDDSWRMCMDFKDLNKVCPKDGYPLPEIYWKVESLRGYPYKCFLDAYKGYHQIKMGEEDEEKTAFITSQGIFCYSKMPFGLKMLDQPTSFWWIRLSKNRLAETWSCKRSHQRCLDDRKGREASTHLLGTHNSCNHGSTNKTTTVQSGGNGKTTQMEIQTRRARHSVPTKDVNKRTNSGGLHCGASRGRHTRYINEGQGRTLRPMDIIHEQIIMHRRCRSWLNNHKSRRDGVTYALRFRFNATNNEAEYEALIAGLQIAGQMGVQNLQANVDSKLVANQVNGIYIAKESSMIKYLEKVKKHG